MRVDTKGVPELALLSDPDTKLESFEFSLMLKAVHDSKHGDTFPPPTHHLGQPLHEPKALEVALLSIKYFEAMLDEGRNLPVH